MAQAIKYPDFIKTPGLRQAFRGALLHGMCWRHNDEHDGRRTEHAYGCGYWMGAANRIMLQLYQGKPHPDFHAAVVATLNAMDEEES